MWQDGQDPKAEDIPDFERRAGSQAQRGVFAKTSVEK